MNGPLYRDTYTISRILDHAETANAATNNFRLKGRRSFNSRATKSEELRERLGIKKTVIQPKNKEKPVKDEKKEKESYMIGYESKFKSNLKQYSKKETQKNTLQSAVVINSNLRRFRTNLK
ncbi:hypothetical protein [Klebsiella quasipneumoniae]|uniref:hypothetical protein n=1 Tax=Klebsiella quasipneumoniae TaxID=1463165 RepID=UPI0011551DA2|nr:hypothetical protein [Klebsiella quasipneumoniae]MBU8944246.1 hypothetical protein [Klebsiella quasipneumoniae]MDN2620906.1 hypothetical protein [Klebsiella quasipneumoniae]UAA05773.1 hypothetical protein KZ661_05455 [Klebsiella quasipneumoniae]URR19195.1 hypothetical protein LT990_05680 [Klebsiella quasipneumoniae]WOK60915.1 hypothetical protein QQE19_24900 [Klebsiella quasipneumoniae]